MEKQISKLSRKKFLSWGMGLTGVLALPAFLRFTGKKKTTGAGKTQRVKMLTQEGKLVEIDVADIPGKKKKIGQADLLTWIHKKSSFQTDAHEK